MQIYWCFCTLPQTIIFFSLYRNRLVLSRIYKHSKICDMIFLVSFWVKCNLAPMIFYSYNFAISSASLCLCMSICVSVSVYVCLHQHVYKCLWRPGDKLEYHFLRAGTFVFSNWISHWFGFLNSASVVSWVVSTRPLLISAFLALVLQSHTAMPYIFRQFQVLILTHVVDFVFVSTWQKLELSEKRKPMKKCFHKICPYVSLI